MELWQEENERGRPRKIERKEPQLYLKFFSWLVSRSPFILSGIRQVVGGERRQGGIALSPSRLQGNFSIGNLAGLFLYQEQQGLM